MSLKVSNLFGFNVPKPGDTAGGGGGASGVTGGYWGFVSQACVAAAQRGIWFSGTDFDTGLSAIYFYDIDAQTWQLSCSLGADTIGAPTTFVSTPTGYAGIVGADTLTTFDLCGQALATATLGAANAQIGYDGTSYHAMWTTAAPNETHWETYNSGLTLTSSSTRAEVVFADIIPPPPPWAHAGGLDIPQGWDGNVVCNGVNVLGGHFLVSQYSDGGSTASQIDIRDSANAVITALFSDSLELLQPTSALEYWRSSYVSGDTLAFGAYDLGSDFVWLIIDSAYTLAGQFLPTYLGEESYSLLFPDGDLFAECGNFVQPGDYITAFDMTVSILAGAVQYSATVAPPTPTLSSLVALGGKNVA